LETEKKGMVLLRDTAKSKDNNNKEEEKARSGRHEKKKKIGGRRIRQRHLKKKIDVRPR